ncbi:TetR family transcriptional regulator [Streptomyces armeniacus]|uniref:TetR family transcriptional regulator n=1 Tax=Streptomyces armeniacus TaxID=83291 RepID=A0A345XVZ2_9ACTN|nr:TetR family transcriptional regulator [Streptomyces armeniacus]AXK35808.1 TetR family transcriptional regulator [Streptomyces armeniacus]
MTRAQAPANAARRGRPPKGATRLSRESIVDATLRVIDAEGVGAVGMRSVARLLGVDAKSLYNHVHGKDGLLDAVAEHLLSGMEIPARTGDVRLDLRAIADAFRDRALRHPEAAALTLTRQLASLEGLAPTEALLSVLRDAGCPLEESVHLLRVFVATLVGTLLREVHAGQAFGVGDSAVAARRQTLERSGLPRTAEAAPHLARFDRYAEYEYTVGTAIELMLSRASRPG